MRKQKKKCKKARESVHAAKKVRLFVVLFRFEEKKIEKNVYKKSGRENVFNNKT